MAENKLIHVIGGGTVAHVRNHLALCAPAYGTTARKLADLCRDHPENKLSVVLHLTRMAQGGSAEDSGSASNPLETNEDVERLVTRLVADNTTKVIFFNPALCDFEGTILDEAGRSTPSGKYEPRLKSRDGDRAMRLRAGGKIVARIRQTRKDITLIAFKTTSGATEDEQYIAALHLLKSASANLVLANDTKTRLNLIVTPEEARYHVTTSRQEALRNLVDMALKRSHLTFTRSTVIAGEAVDWNCALVPPALREVVNACITAGAYKPFRGATVGHFAAKLSETEFITSKRKTNFNDLQRIGLVRIRTSGPDSVLAYGAKPSVGGQSQRIIFDEHTEYDCIVHFHCPLRSSHPDDIPIRSQREFECGSHECGRNTSNGLRTFDLGDGNVLSAVMLDHHGPNLVFHHTVEPRCVIDFIHRNFDLSAKTGGYVAAASEPRRS